MKFERCKASEEERKTRRRGRRMQLGCLERKRVCLFLPLTCRTPLFVHFRAVLEKDRLRSASTKQLQRIKCRSKTRLLQCWPVIYFYTHPLDINKAYPPPLPPFLLLQRTISIQTISTTPAGYKSIF